MENIKTFDADGVGVRNGCWFGMPFSPSEAGLVLISVPWDVTSSYGDGSAMGPEAMIEASTQLDFYDPWAPDAWRRGIATLPVDDAIRQRSNDLRGSALAVIEAQEAGWSPDSGAMPSESGLAPERSGRSSGKSGQPDQSEPPSYFGGGKEGCFADEGECVQALGEINAASRELNDAIYAETRKWLSENKLVGLIGGDHSTPYGLIKAVGENISAGVSAADEHVLRADARTSRADGSGVKGSFGILHLDAHCDLRPAYEGFEHSHASIMYNVLRDVPAVEKLVQVGVRDFSAEELEIARNNHKVRQFTGAELSENEFRGMTWAEQCDIIVNALPQSVYVSFDIDFLSPEFCPGTGTPVPGGRTFDEAVYLIKRVADSGRVIVGFDLCEVSPRTTLDASIGARVLFKLCSQALRRTEI